MGASFTFRRSSSEMRICEDVALPRLSGIVTRLAEAALKELGKQLELPAACTLAIDPASAFSLAVAGLLAADGGASLLSLNRRSSTLPVQLV